MTSSVSLVISICFLIHLIYNNALSCLRNVAFPTSATDTGNKNPSSVLYHRELSLNYSNTTVLFLTISMIFIRIHPFLMMVGGGRVELPESYDNSFTDCPATPTV